MHVCTYISYIDIYIYVLRTHVHHIYIYIYVRSVIQAIGSFARQDFGRAIRGRNTNSPNTINYLPRNILSFCFTSRLRWFPAPTYFSISFPSISILNHHTHIRFPSPMWMNTAIVQVTDQHIYDYHQWFQYPYTLTRIHLYTS